MPGVDLSRRLNILYNTRTAQMFGNFRFKWFIINKICVYHFAILCINCPVFAIICLRDDVEYVENNSEKYRSNAVICKSNGSLHRIIKFGQQR